MFRRDISRFLVISSAGGAEGGRPKLWPILGKSAGRGCGTQLAHTPPQKREDDFVIRGIWRAVIDEVRDRPFAYGVLGAFLLAGPVVASLLFPEAPPAVGIVGGLALGAYAALCAVPQKFL